MANPKTNLAEIHEIMETAVANENETPRVAVGESYVRIAGFAVPDAQRVAQRQADRRSVLARYKESAEDLRRKLKETDVAPLAVLPEKAWNRICREAGLYRVTPGHDSHIRVSDRLGDIIQTVSVFLNIGLWLAFIVAAAYAAVLIGSLCDDRGPLVLLFVFTCVAFVVAMIVCLVAAMDAGHGPIMWTYLLLQKAIASIIPRKLFLVFVLPDHAEPEGNHYTHAAINLPTPPDHVAEILRKARSYALSVACAPEALRFAAPQHEVLRITRRHQERQENWVSMLPHLDPIVYVKSGAAVAIIAQFGEFPIEREVVERVAATDFLA